MAVLVRKAFELSGIVPLGVFLLVHVGSLSAVLLGAPPLGVSASTGALVLVLEVALVWTPLLFHSAWGLFYCFGPWTVDVPRARTLALRVTGVLALGLLAAHWIRDRLPIVRGERAPQDVLYLLAQDLSSTQHGVPVSAVIHLLGLFVVAAHFSLGLQGFTERWGLLSARHSRATALTLGFLLSAIGTAVVVELATGSWLPAF